MRSWHHHQRGQLLYAVSGIMQVETAEGTWVVAPEQAVWVPPGAEHCVFHQEGIAMRTLYIDRTVASELPQKCCVVNVSPLMQQLILRAMQVGCDYEQGGAAWRLMAVILDELRSLQPEPMHLPHPRDARLKKIAAGIISEPSDSRTLSEWAAGAGASERTLARLFVQDTGMTFGAWRERMRLMEAIRRLVAGDSVTSVAYNLGYQSTSAFITMFKKNMGESPTRFTRNRT